MMKSAVIIGGGPAGCQCALWLHLLGHQVLLIEQSSELGGLQAKSPYSNDWMAGVLHQTGVSFAKQIEVQLTELKVPFLLNTQVHQINSINNGFEISIDARNLTAHCLVIATGVKPKSGHLLEADNVMIGPGERVFSYAFQNKRVAILGGGDNACENYAAVLEKQPVYCHLYARSLRGSKKLASLVKPEDMFLGQFDVDQNTMSITYANQRRQYDVMLVMYGWKANFPKALLGLQSTLCDEKGFIMTNAFCETRISQIYAIGEIANRAHPCVTTAMADGVVAAKAIQAFLENQ